MADCTMRNRNMIKCHLSARTDKNKLKTRNNECCSRQLKAYDAIVSKCNDMIFINSNENQQLTQLRDWFLPMLMNGQVTVSDQSAQAK